MGWKGEQNMKKLTTLILVILISLTVIGCSTVSSTYQLPPEREEGTKVELTLLSSHTDQEYQVLLEVVRLFERENSDIKINVDRVPPGAHRNRITTALALGETPDMAMVDMDLVPLLAQRSAIIDLAILGAREITEEYLEGAILSSSLNNSVWGIPDRVSTKVLYYNKGILDEAGLNYPDDQWSLDELAYAAEQISSQLEGTYGFHLGDNFLDTIPLFSSFGARALREDGTMSLLDSSEAIEALDFISNLVEKGVVPKPWSDEVIDVSLGFKEEKYAFVLADITLLNELQYTDIEYGLTFVPNGPTGSYSDVTGTSMVIFRSSQYPREAYKFMRFLTSEQMQIKWANELGQIPVNKAASSKIDFEKHPHLNLFLEQFQRVHERPMLVDPINFEEIFSRELEKVFNGEKTSQEALKDAVNSVNKLKTP